MQILSFALAVVGFATATQASNYSLSDADSLFTRYMAKHGKSY